MSKPEKHTSDPVYSNFDHAIDPAVVAELEADPGNVCAQHAAWNFCGYVWKATTGEEWVNEVWRYGAPVTLLTGETAEDVIRAANNQFGDD